MSYSRSAFGRAHAHATTASGLSARAALAFLLCAGLVLSLLTACSPAADTGTHITTTSDITLTSTYPSAEDLSEPARDALTELPLASHLMLRPVELTTAEEIPADGITLTITLPAELPEDAVARFAYYDEEIESWVPTPTERSGLTVTTTTTHLSLWTVIVDVTQEAWDNVSDGWNDFVAEVQASVEESWKAWSTLGPGAWIYRTTGQLFGIQGDAPECEGDIYNTPGLEWVDAAVVSQLTGIPVENQSVLRCVGVDPEDSTRLQVKAVANRGFGFKVQFARNFEPEVEWSYLAELATADVGAFSELVANLLDNEVVSGLTQDLLVGTTEMSFSVSEEEVQLAQQTGHKLVSFVRPNEMQMAYSILAKLMFESIEDALPVSFFSVIFATRDCFGANLPGEWGDALSVATWMLGCAQTIVDDEFAADIDEVATKMAKSENASYPPALTKMFSSKQFKKVSGKVVNVLKWLDVVILTLNMTDYWGERTDNPWWVDIKAKTPDASALDGTWCNIYGECALTVSAPAVTVSAPDQFATTKNIAGDYTVIGGYAAGGDSPGCEAFPVDGPLGVAAMVHCPKGVPYTGEALINCGCGNSSIEDVQKRYSDQERIYLITTEWGMLTAEVYGRK